MSNVIHTPAAARRMPRMVTDQVTIEPPMEVEQAPAVSVLEKILKFGIPVLMVTMMVIMFSVMGSSGMRGPMMMMMMMVMMVSMVAGQITQMFGSGSHDVEMARRDNALALSQQRGKAHAIGNVQHTIATRNFPHPQAMPQLMDQGHDTFWSVVPDVDSSPAAGSAMTANPYLLARVGTGMIPLEPAIQTAAGKTLLPELNDPASRSMYVSFIAVQNVVTNCPIGVNLNLPAVGLLHNEEGRMKVARTIALSLAYGHSPNDLNIAVVTDSPEEWDWIKWLPHNLNTFAPMGRAGYGALAWDTMTAAVSDLADYAPLAAERGRRIFVLVDLPDTDVAVPHGLYSKIGRGNLVDLDGVTGISGVTFLTVRAAEINRLVAMQHRYRVEDDGAISSTQQSGFARIDSGITREVAEYVARQMARYRPPNFGYQEVSLTDAADTAPSDTSAPTMLEAIGAEDLDAYDLRAKWRSTDKVETFNVPIGFQVAKRGEVYKPTGELAYLDILQNASGGTGPHGAFSGGTGTGKSFLLKAIILMLCATYSPKRLNIIGADFKGGSTFLELARLPHFLANVTNLDDAADLVNRTRDALEGENRRRQTIFKNLGVEDIFAYRELQKKRPELDDIPDLLFVADEFREFMVNNREFKDMFDSLLAVGRSTGIHLLLTSQFIDQSLLGNSMEHLKFGISLKVGSNAYSQAVIHRPDAAQLPPNRVAIMWSNDLLQQHWTTFQGFNHGAPYVKPVEVVEGEVEQVPTDTGADTSLVVSDFTLTTAASGISERDHEPDTAAMQSLGQRDAAVVEEEIGEDAKDQFTALVDTIIEQSKGYTDVYQLWQTPLSVPMSMADVGVDEWKHDPSKGVVIRLGDIDYPREHKRVPLNADFSAHGNLVIYGDGGAGKTTTVKTLIASSAMRFRGNWVSWLIYDNAGTGLADMAEWPNVSAYGTRTDTEMWLRIRGEMDRVYEMREAAFGKHRPANFADYLARRSEWGINDPYGHLMVVIDGFDDFIDQRQYDTDFINYFKQLVNTAPQYGIHLVLTSTGKSNRARSISDLISGRIVLSMQDITMMGGVLPRESRAKMGEVPTNQPGRGVDGSLRNAQSQPIWLHSLVMLPVLEKIEPVSVINGVETYDTISVSYSDQIVSLGERIKSLHDASTYAPKVTPVGTDLPFARVWETFSAFDFRSLPPKDRPVPVGVNCGTGLVYALDPNKGQRHLVLTGDIETGMTTALRAHMTAVSNLMTPDEARIIILDGGGDLYSEVEKLTASGHMKPSSYAMGREQMAPLMANLANLARNRAPKGTDDLGRMRDRTYFSGAEVFVYVDRAHTLTAQGMMGAAEGTLEAVVAEMGSGLDLGIRFITGIGSAHTQQAFMSNKFFKPLVTDLGATVGLLSGTGTGQVWQKERFERLPKGRAKLISQSGVEVVQFSNITS